MEALRKEEGGWFMLWQVLPSHAALRFCVLIISVLSTWLLGGLIVRVCAHVCFRVVKHFLPF